MLFTHAKRRQDAVNKIVVLNPKGGCGKSTLVTNLAASFAYRGTTPTIVDYDPQGSSIAWLARRNRNLPKIQGVEAFNKSARAARKWEATTANDATNLIVDSPASISHDDLRELTRGASSILMPVLPSFMDIHAAPRSIADLLLVAHVDRSERKLAVVANRTRSNTRSFSKLMRFLDSLGIPIIAVLRDTQNFVHAAEKGIGVRELPRSRAGRDAEQIERIADWLENWQVRRNATATVINQASSENADTRPHRFRSA